MTGWSPRLILHRPYWLAERRGNGVLPAMRWYPFVTFFKVTADLGSAYRTPPGYGHRYGAVTVVAWVAVAAPPGWTPDRTGQLAAVVAGGWVTARRKGPLWARPLSI
jgi:uncharacterized membrane protein